MINDLKPSEINDTIQVQIKIEMTRRKVRLINEKEFELVSSAKILGVLIPNSLEWISHVNHVVKKTSKRLYLLILLKRSNAPAPVSLLSACTFMQRIWVCSKALSQSAVSIISPASSYTDSLINLNIDSLEDRCDNLCKTLFGKAVTNNDHMYKLYHLLSPKKTVQYITLEDNVYLTVLLHEPTISESLISW